METEQKSTLVRQDIISQAIKKIESNFSKDSSSRKTAGYLKIRLDSLQNLWSEYEMNHTALLGMKDKTYEYYTTNAFEKAQAVYTDIKTKLESFQPIDTGSKSEDTEEKDAGTLSRTDELRALQRTNFRAFSRFISNIKLKEIIEKWDIEDKLKTLQSRWKVIDEVHWQIDNLLVGCDTEYELEFSKFEDIYELNKRELNRKLNNTIQQCESAPKIEIPIFNGNYTQWPTFLDLYSEAIHKNMSIPKARKMQHLKGKLRGEAERLVQHLTVSADNYDSCWEILNHRYNNLHLLFTKQMQTFMSQPTIQHQNAHELKRLHDTSLETVHAIHNLGVDTTTWDPILVHILTGKLDSQTYSDYMEARKAPRELPSFEEFITFIESKFTALEPVSKRKQPFHSNKQTNIHNSQVQTTSSAKDSFNKQKRFFPKACHASAERICPICKANHILIYCKTFQDMTSELKIRSLDQQKICKNCLYAHEGKQCNSHKRCKVCHEQHHTTLHDVARDTASLTSSGEQPNSNANTKPSISQRKVNHASNDFNEVLLATVQLRVKAADGTYKILRCLLDQGSQINIITESAAQRLGLSRRKQNSTISGIGITTNHSNGTVHLDCESLYGDHKFTTEALVMAKVLNHLPNYSFEKQEWPHVQNIKLADPEYNMSRAVDILLDAGVYADVVMSGVLRGPTHAPVAQQTKLGWVLLGNMNTFNCHVVLSDNDISRFWELEDITDVNDAMTVDDKYCETLYANTTRRLGDGRYEVKIPMKENFTQQLGTSKPQAVAQFRQLEKRLAKDKTLASSYKDFINEYKALDHMKECTTPTEPSCFLPHHGVLRPDSTTTKLRVVFNASAKTSTGQSLNQLMECGPNLQQDLQAMILRWRTFEYVYTADIEKFYRQIRIQEEDQHLQKIVWRDSPTVPIKEFQLSTVTYGTKSAPYLAMRTVKQLIKDDGAQYPLAAEILENQLYVDDLLGGSNDFITAQEAQHQLVKMLKGGGFNLRKWASNDTSLLKGLPNDLISQKMLDFKDAETNKTLGITWNPCTDQFTFKQTPPSNKRDVNTKRTLLSDISKLYDPLGWLSPVTVKAKLIFQQAWMTTLSWDDPLPNNIQQDWEQFRQEMPNIHDIAISRWIGNTQQAVEFHGFCDASEKAYGCVIYCKTTDETGQTVVKLVAAKTKLAPIKKPISLPRLELCGAVLLSRLMKKVIDTTISQTVTVHGWTDSMVVLGWLQGDVSRWKTFVANRVTQITNELPSACWRHVKSEDNPADCASRGLSPRQILQHSLWWEAPSWLKINNLPVTRTNAYETTEEEKRQKQVSVTQVRAPLIETLLQKHSSMTHVTRVLSWVMRFVNNARDATHAKRFSHLTTADIELAQNMIVKTIQQIAFADDIYHLQKHNKVRSTSKILNLYPVLDENGILRVGGRLQNADLKRSTKHPMILPNGHKLSALLIDQAHQNTLHGGARLTLAYLRNRYWLLGGMRTVKKHLGRCVTCHRFKTQASNQMMAELPKPRVTPSRPFTHTGVDFTGYVDVKANKGRGIKTVKAYIAIFICLCTKAIHLELVSDLSTATFLGALKRLCARRGTPKHIYSDNGTNFVGAARALDKERQDALRHFVNSDLINNISDWGTEWHFNAPSWPTAGGLWEAAVKSMKYHLKRVLGEQKLTFEEFMTLLTQIEGCLNSRPLVAITDNTDDIDCLTPGHFLIGDSALAPPLSSEVSNTSLTTRWRLTENMHREFWKRWSRDYLQTLQVRGKWHSPKSNIVVDDIVLVKDDQTPPARWHLGRVTETHPGADGLVRVVTLKTKTGYLKRPVTKLSRLPIEQEQQTLEVKQSDSKQTIITPSKPKRQLRQRKHKSTHYSYASYFNTLMVLILTCVVPSTQQLVNVTSLDPARLIYFDKFADMQMVQDEWKMVVYHNMTTYWKNVDAIEQYVDHLQGLCKRRLAYLAIASQFQHEIDEMRQYNEVLRSEHGIRRKRGLVNGIGYIANSLFGVLDERFAEKYSKDIKLLQSNDDHLLNLFKEHTSIIEGEYNLLKRNEKVMNQQFFIINKHLRDAEQQFKTEQDQAIHVTSTIMAANMMLANLRRVQDMLLDLVTDVRNGKVDTHLLKPDAFENQLNIISGQVPKGLSLPCTNSQTCIRVMYKLARVHVRLVDDFLLFEVKIPLVTDEQYELTKVIPIHNIKGTSTVSVITTSEYLAVNLKKDMLISLKQQDLTTCIHIHNNQLICALNKPVYEINSKATLCEAQIINNDVTTSCRTRVSSCYDEWVKLHNPGTWLFTCCEECSTRIFCSAGITSQKLYNTGIITLSDGCMLRGDHYSIHSHHNLHSELNIENEVIYIPESSINDLITTNNNFRLQNMQPETQDEELNAIKRRIDLVKEQQDTISLKATEEDKHHYVMYSFITFCGIAICIWCGLKLKGRCASWNRVKSTSKSSRKQTTVDMELNEISNKSTERNTERITPRVDAVYAEPGLSQFKVAKMDSATSPTPRRVK